MRKFSLLLLLIVASFAMSTIKASCDSKDWDNKAYDCSALYILRDNKIDKFGLPEFNSVASVELPKGTKGSSIAISGNCGDSSRTLLVLSKDRGNKSRERILSYTIDLQFVSEITFLGASDIDEIEAKRHR